VKKRLAAAITSALVVGVASTTFAAANPFVDVPAKHWSYDAVAKLAQAGIVDGYGDGTFRGDKTMTRYEMAQIVAKAMTKADKADAANKAAIDKLAVEYAAELNNLGVRVSKLEDKVGNIKFTGEARFRYDNNDFDGVIQTSEQRRANNSFALRTRITAEGQINDEWKYVARFQNEQDLRHSGGDNETEINNAYVTGSIGQTNVTAGRFDYMPMYGNVVDSTLDGVKVSFGNKLKTTLYYGREDNTFDTINGFSDNSIIGDDVTYTGIEFKYGVSKATNLTAAYHNVDSDALKGAALVNDNKLNIWEAGFDTKFAKDLLFKASYAKSDAEDLDKAWLAGVQYRAANIKKVGSWDMYANYRNQEIGAIVDTTFDPKPTIIGGTGYKGFEVGFDYVPVKNSKVQMQYASIKDHEDSGVKDKFYRAQIEFFF